MNSTAKALSGAFALTVLAAVIAVVGTRAVVSAAPAIPNVACHYADADLVSAVWDRDAAVTSNAPDHDGESECDYGVGADTFGISIACIGTTPVDVRPAVKPWNGSVVVQQYTAGGCEVNASTSEHDPGNVRAVFAVVMDRFAREGLRPAGRATWLTSSAADSVVPSQRGLG